MDIMGIQGDKTAVSGLIWNQVQNMASFNLRRMRHIIAVNLQNWRKENGGNFIFRHVFSHFTGCFTGKCLQKAEF